MVIDHRTGEWIDAALERSDIDPGLTDVRLTAGLSPESATRLAALIVAFREYRAQRAELLAASRAAEDLASARERFAALQVLRRRLFGEEVAQVLFGDDERRTLEALQRLAAESS
ncbi:lipase secretion chaperone [Ramlibacter tataouinensis]|uniref:Lipase helper protein n=1 Tax=Ramlibacter tataouinensis TaxID=94132 RepID=A0A127JS26_9BURK|nr:lipase secretion chaperone [Ramlibacter tataouinensis]AMO22693.1 hypothetical protein UC35_07130 [Ramlibacter tataouinensis]